MIPSERDEVRVDKYDVLEIVYDRLAVQEIVCDHEEVPGTECVSSSTHSLDLPVQCLTPSVALLWTEFLGAL